MLVVFTLLWLLIAPFLAGYFPEPLLFINAPFLVMLIGAAILWVVFTAVAWVLRKLGH